MTSGAVGNGSQKMFSKKGYFGSKIGWSWYFFEKPVTQMVQFLALKPSPGNFYDIFASF